MTTVSLVLLLTLIVAWLTAAATALRTVSRIFLRHWAETSLTGAAAEQLSLDRPQRLLLSAGTGIASVVFAMGAVIGLRSDGRPLLQTLALSTVVLLVLGQLIPRAIARRWATPLVPYLLPGLRVIDRVTAPLLMIGDRVARRMTPRFAFAAEAPRDALEDLLREGELEGVGEASESAIISGVVEFSEKRAADVMTPRRDIVAAERNEPAMDVMRRVAESKVSRMPVFEKDLDHIVGLVHSFDVFARPDAPLSVLRRVTFATQDAGCHDLMRRLLRERVHLAIIQDAAGATLGLVTLEDLVEELVGDIHDEHDDPNPALS